jgi:hypothetical protein
MHKIDGTEKCFGDCYSYEKKKNCRLKHVVNWEICLLIIVMRRDYLRKEPTNDIK